MTKKVIETTNGWYMENEKEKVELEDIIGLVQTDEPTNSVQLKKEAQLSICEKRVRELEKENEQLKSEIKELQVKYSKQLVDYNGLGCEYDWLSEKNEQLKSTLYFLLNVIQNKCPKYYPKCKEIVRNCIENDFNNTENDGGGE